MFAIRLGFAQRLTKLSDFHPAEVPLARRASQAADAFSGVTLDFAKADRVFEHGVQRMMNASAGAAQFLMCS
jgi:hypothetical protein